MALKARSLWGTCMKFKPHFVMVLTQIGLTFQNFMADASFHHGMNPHVYVTYRSFIAGFFIFPFAYFLERIGLTINLYFEGMKHTSPAFVVSTLNAIAASTFVIAILLRLETLDLRKGRCIAKVVGTLVSLAGVMTMTLYKGRAMRNLWHPIIHIQRNGTIDEQWLKGSIVCVASCISCSTGYIMQAMTLKHYPAKLSLTTWVCFLGAAQSAVFTVITSHNPADWRIGFNIDLWSTIFGGIVVGGLITFLQLWGTQKRGPVFVSMFTPVQTILVAILAYFVFGEKLYLGSIIGSVIVIFGLYSLLWGKEGDQGVHIRAEENQSFSTCLDEKMREPNLQKITSDENDIQGQP